MTHGGSLTPPERATERLQAKRRKALFNADRRKHGACAICTFRDTTFGIVHCKGWPDRQRGMCQQDDKLPKFAFDDTTMGKYR
jgi:hypothetical protein